MKKNYFLIIVLLLNLSSIVSAQWNYQAVDTRNVAGVYNDLGLSGTVITTNYSGDAMSFDDDNSSVQEIGFSFDFNGQSFTQFVLNSNGFIKLGNAAPSANNIYYPLAPAVPSTLGSCINAPDSNLIYIMNHDLGPATSGGLPEYRVYTSGIPGQRICTIQFKNLADKIGGTNIQFSNINFQVKLFEGSNEIDFVYGSWTISANPTNYIGNAVGIKGNSPANSVNYKKSSSEIWIRASVLDGAYDDIYLYTFNIRNSVINDVQGMTFKFIAMKHNDAKVLDIYTLGKLPIPFATPHTISAAITNTGLDTLHNLPVTLRVTGANSFSPASQVVPLLAPHDTVVVSFPVFNPVTTGINSVSVSVPVDDDTTNNFRIYSQDITNGEYNYAYLNAPASGYGGIADFASKFVTHVPAFIDQVVFNALYLAFDNERPVRVNTFFTGTGTPRVWTDLSTQFYSVSRFNIEARLTLVNITDTSAEICPYASCVLTSKISGASYQWQVNTGTGFSNINTDVNYVGVNTSALQIKNPSTSWYGYQYRCLVNGNPGDIQTISFISKWRGTVNTSWENPANWSCNKLPDSNTDVIIPNGFVIVNSNVSVRSLTVNPGAIFIITAGKSVTITH